MELAQLRFDDFNKVESELKYNCLYLVQFPDDDGSLQLIVMRYNKVGRQLYATIRNEGVLSTIILDGEMLDECCISKFEYV